MFHFPAFPPHALCVQAWVTGFKALPGFPIRKSSDHSSVDSSPRHIAASHVLHRLLVPRHPPCALNNLATKIKMLASTVQFSNYERKPATPTRPDITPKLAQPVSCSNQPAHPPHRVTQRQPDGADDQTRGHSLPQDPTAYRTRHHPPAPPSHTGPGTTTGQPSRKSQCSTPMSTPDQPPGRPSPWTRTTHYRQTLARKLLRKEVIQPHLPVRLPCYDFVPIAGPTFDGSPHKGWATGFGCYRLS
jgi:hypothetical protein